MANLNVPNLPPAILAALLLDAQRKTALAREQGLILHRDYPRERDTVPNVAQSVDVIEAADAAVTLATVLTLANEMRTKVNAHVAETTKHKVADATNVITSPVATDQTSANTLLNEIRTDFNAHHDGATWHDVGPGAGKIGAAPADIATAVASDLATSITLANALKAMFNAHVRSGAPTLVLAKS